MDRQFFVQPEFDCDVSSDSNSSSEPDGEDSSTRRNLFALPQVQSRGCRGSQVEQLLIDYSKSILMTSEEYITAMTAKASRKEVVAREREEWKLQAEQKKAAREQEKARKEADKLMRQIQAEHKKADRERERMKKAVERARKAAEVEARRRGRSIGTGQYNGAAEKVGDPPMCLRPPTVSAAAPT